MWLLRSVRVSPFGPECFQALRDTQGRTHAPYPFLDYICLKLTLQGEDPGSFRDTQGRTHAPYPFLDYICLKLTLQGEDPGSLLSVSVPNE